MNTNDYTEANRAAWNETAPIHAAQNMESLLEHFKTPGYSCLHKPFEVERLGKLNLAGKSVAQLCCNNARELLSVKNLFGAGRCVGFDISEAFLEQARALNEAAGLDAEFVRGSVLEIPDAFSGQFDLVYVTIGALGWLPDLDAFMAVVERLLRPGGHVFIYEMHPILDMFDNDQEAMKNPLELKHSYFRTTPYAESQGLDYYGGERYDSKTMYWFHHKLSEIITGLIRRGLQIIAFDEFDFDISNAFAHLALLEPRVPMCYILEARKNQN
jgi:ubiquinone/menaquinone biosynthesis C-methylase UbiE